MHLFKCEEYNLVLKQVYFHKFSLFGISLTHCYLQGLKAVHTNNRCIINDDYNKQQRRFQFSKIINGDAIMLQ